MSFKAILGQGRAVTQLRQALQSDRLAHAYLFYGPNGTGKKLAALQFAKALYCGAATADACDTCTTCHKIAGGNHPDVLLIEPEGASVRIEAIRRIQNRLSYKPYESQRTTIIIDGCELLTLPASHALLKTLEEPPGNALLVLLAGRKEALPLTIVSRCQLLPFQPLAPATHRQHSVAARGGRRDGAGRRFTGGRQPGCVFGHGAGADTRQATGGVYPAVRCVGAKDPGLFSKARQLAGRREQCEELLRWLELLCRDMVVLKVAPTAPLHNQDLHAELHELARPLTQ